MLLVALALEVFLLTVKHVWLMPTSTRIPTIRVNSFVATKNAQTALEVLELNANRVLLQWFSEDPLAAILLA